LSLEDDKIDGLLAPGGLGGPQYDAVFDKVLARTEVREPPAVARRLRWSVVAGTALASGMAAALLLVHPAGGRFTAKGTAAAADGALEIGCGPSGSHVCRMGGTLMFTVNSAQVSGTLGAYAEPVGGPPGQRIWYFPTAGGTAPVVLPGRGTTVVPEGIEIGAEHRLGRYRVTVWIADRPLGRADIDRDARGVRGHAVFDLEVVP
jgi:hypothetical protein